MVIAEVLAQMIVWALGDYIAPIAAIIAGFSSVAFIGAGIIKILDERR